MHTSILSKTRLIRCQKIIVVYIVMHGIVNYSFKYLTANWKDGNRLVVH